MKYLLPILIGVSALIPACRPSEDPGGSGSDPKAGEEVAVKRQLDPNAAGIRIEPSSGVIGEIDSLLVTFPVEMVSEEMVNRMNLRNPLVMQPPVEDSWFEWVSTTSGRLQLNSWGARSPVTRTVTLREGLVDASGEPVDAKDWGAEFSHDEFQIADVLFLHPDEDAEPPAADHDLATDQVVQMVLTRDVSPREIAEKVRFVEVETRKEHPVRVALTQYQPETPQGLVLVEPAQPLPADREMRLVIDRLESGIDDLRLPYLRIYPAGRTRPIRTTWGRGYNQPRRGKFVRIAFSKEVDRESVNPGIFQVEPEVAVERVEHEGKELLIFGGFESEKNYRVTPKEGIQARDGSMLDRESIKPVAVTIPKRRPAVVLEAERFAKRAGRDIQLRIETCRTEELEWTLSRVTGGQYAKVRDRLREFAEWETDDEGNAILDPRDGSIRFKSTRALAPELDLPVVAEGGLVGSSDEELVPRDLEIGAQAASPGLYLLEIAGRSEDGRMCGNRCLISVSNLWIRRWKESAGDGERVRVTGVDDSQGVGGADIAYFSYAGEELGKVSTNDDGFAVVGDSTAYCYVSDGEGEVLLNFSDSWLAPDYVDRWERRTKRVTMMVSNGDLYQPGDEASFQITARDLAPDGGISIPAGEEVKLQLRSETPGFPETEIEVTLDEFGSASGTWSIPENALTGRYTISTSDWSGYLHFMVSEFRIPDFAVTVSAPPTVGRVAELEVASTRFQGTPHAGAKVRWSSHWVGEDWIYFSEDEEGSPWIWHEHGDRYSPEVAHQGIEGALSALLSKGGGSSTTPAHAPGGVEQGEAVLDDQGRLSVKSECPFPANRQLHRARVFWVVEVISAGGESRREVTEQRLQFAENHVAAVVDWGDEGEEIRFASISVNDTPGDPVPVEIETYRREVLVSKEQVGDHLVRYRNTPEFTSIDKGDFEAPGRYRIPGSEPGDYVVVIRPKDEKAAIISCQILGHEGGGSSPVLDAFSMQLVPDQREYRVGEIASIQLRSPIGGWARVTLESDRLIRELPSVEVSGDGSRVEVPLKAEDFPNVFVRVEVTNSEGENGIPVERIGTCELRVIDPARELTVEVDSGVSGAFRPGDEVVGAVWVRAGDTPVADARVTIMAVDEALLSLGAWSPPDPRGLFHPNREHGVKVGRALSKDWYPSPSKRLRHAQKGYIIGGGEVYAGGLAMSVRENMDPRPLWSAELMTGDEGGAAFQFTLPDSLTEYRLVAYAQGRQGGFGKGTGKVMVAKPLRIAPFLPAFVREGDAVDLRWELETDAEAELRVEETVRFGGAAVEEDGGSRQLSVRRPGTSLSGRSVRIREGTAGQQLEVLIMAVAGEEFRDAVRIRIPVRSAGVDQTEVRSGVIEGGQALELAALLEGLPENADCDLYFSGTRWLPKLANLPAPEDAEITAADLGGALMCALMRPELDEYLPRLAGGDGPDLRPIQKATDQLMGMMLTSEHGRCLPRWPGGSEADEVGTALVSFALQAGLRSWTGQEQVDYLDGTIPIPEDLLYELKAWRWSVVDTPFSESRDKMPVFARCVALLAVGENDEVEARSMHRIGAQIRTMYKFREDLSMEEKALLLLANNRFLNPGRPGGPVKCLSPGQLSTLTREVEAAEVPDVFRPEALGTPLRSEAIRLHVLSEIGRVGSHRARSELRRIMKPLLDSSADISGQEGMWVLLAARSAIRFDSPAEMGDLADEHGALSSPNDVSLAWLGHPATALRNDLPAAFEFPSETTWMLRAAHQKQLESPLSLDALKLERRFINLTESSRDGSEGAEPELGDYLLIHYKLTASDWLYQFKLEERLPAGLELVNPDLASVRNAFPIDSEDVGSVATMSYSQRGQDGVELYFDQLEPSHGNYAVLTRVAAVGEFHWPAAYAAPLYDKRIRASTTDGTLKTVSR